MRLTSFRHDGRPSYGAVTDQGVIDLGAVLGPRYPDLRALLTAGALEAAREAAAGAAPALACAELELLPVIPNPDKILCIGLNYRTHVEETGRPDADYPTIFVRFANSQIGHRQPVPKPALSEKFDYEGELAVVIGRRGRHIADAEALAHCAGYACYCDFSVRDWQLHTSQFTPGKNFPGTGAFGPWLVSADELADPQALALRTRVNGETVQDADTGQMIFPVAELIAYISTFTELVPGDVIATGTPGGVGSRRTPRLWLQPGDRVEVEIERIGTLECPIGSDA